MEEKLNEINALSQAIAELSLRGAEKNFDYLPAIIALNARIEELSSLPPTGE